MQNRYPTTIREEELKNCVGKDFFGQYDTTKIIGNIDFCVAVPAAETLFEDETESLVWANPTKGLLHIESEDIEKLEIRNLLGQLVLETRKTGTLNLEGLEKGVYFLIASNKNGLKAVTKVIKE